MKFQLLLSACLGLVSADGIVKAPYLPSGWRPKGPAFELPTEIKNQSAFESTTEFTPEIDSEGSTFLREYGPPNFNQDSELDSVRNSVLTQDSSRSISQETQPINDSVTYLLEEPVQHLVSEDILQDLTVQALPDVEPNLNFRRIPEEIQSTASAKDFVQDFRVIHDENDNTQISANENFGAITQNDEELYEYIKKVQENAKNAETRETVLENNKNLAEIVVSEEQSAEGKSNYDVLLVNNQNGKILNIREDESIKSNDRQGKGNIFERHLSARTGFREYGPPVEDHQLSNNKDGAFQGPEYLAPTGGLKRDSRWTRKQSN